MARGESARGWQMGSSTKTLVLQFFFFLSLRRSTTRHRSGKMKSYSQKTRRRRRKGDKSENWEGKIHLCLLFSPDIGALQQNMSE